MQPAAQGFAFGFKYYESIGVPRRAAIAVEP